MKTTEPQLCDSQSTAPPPLISIIIPCYNYGRFLGEAIESALRQTWRSVEIIVIDDGSSDNTAEVAARYPEVRLLSQGHGGPSDARNAGVRASHGEYLTFLDADDVLLPEALSRGITELSSSPDCAFSWGAYIYADEDTNPIGGAIVPEFTGSFYQALMRGCFTMMLATALFRRSILNVVGGFDPTLHCNEEYDLYLRIARQFPVRQHQYLVACYRQHKSNLTRNILLDMTTLLEVLDRQGPFVKTDSEALAIYRDNNRRWTDIYYKKLLRDAAYRLRSRDNGTVGLKSMIFVFKQSPFRFLRLIVMYIGSKIRREFREWLQSI